MIREKCSRDRQSDRIASRYMEADWNSGKLADYMPGPYPNEEAARAGNGGYVHCITGRDRHADDLVVYPQIFLLSSRPDTEMP